MKQRFISILLLGVNAAVCQPQATSIAPADQPGHHTYRFAVGPANGDPHARTLAEIFAVNQSFAKKGNTEAAFELALAYLQGYGVEQDLAQAEHWFHIGATDADEKSIVGELFATGDYFAKDLEAAARWLTAAGRPSDFFELAQAYRQASPPQIDKATAIYLDLLKQTGHPEVRRAQMEMGNLVLDTKYSAGDDARGRALNLEWARTIAQELLGGEENKIAMDYELGRHGILPDKAMALRFLERAAVYNIDLAQGSYANAITNRDAPNPSSFDDVVWVRLASEKQSDDLARLKVMESGMNAQQHLAAEAAYQALVETRKRSGAYYPQGDPLRDPTLAALAAMPQDDPDVQLRSASALDKAAQTNDKIYRQGMDIYRTVRDRREMDIRFVLGRNLLNGTNGVPQNKAVAINYLHEAADRGSIPAKDLLAALSGDPSR